MELLNKTDLKELAEQQDGWHVSIYMPAHRAGRETQQDPIRLKNLVGRALDALVAAGVRAPDARERLEPAARLVEDGGFWRRQSDGLALFISGEGTRTFRLPLDFQELVVVADRYHIKPLLPLLSGDGRFYVLALSQDEARLLLGTKYSVAGVELGGVPTSKAEALRFDDPERRLQFHTASGPTGGGASRPAMFYGTEAPAQDQKDELLRYFQKLDAGVAGVLAGEGAPLVLAGVDYLLPIYRQANSYPHLYGEGIEGNPEELSAQELHQRAWGLVEPHFLRERDAAAQRYRELAGAGQASSQLAEIVPAAFSGRVDTLFVTLHLQQWGAYDPATGEIEVRQERQEGDLDLADLAAVQTLLHGGTVYAVDEAGVPGQMPQAALYRY